MKHRLYSDQVFKTKVKVRAAELDLTIPEVTKRLAKNPVFDDLLRNIGKDTPKKRGRFEFDF